jgi:hypothetical protein
MTTTTRLKGPGATVAALAAAVMAVLLTVLAVNSSKSQPAADASASSVAPPSYTVPDVVDFVVYGDSISQADSRAFTYLDIGKATWVSHVDRTKTRFVGGVALAGSTPKKMVSFASSEVKGDLWIVELGTNEFNLRAGQDPLDAITKDTLDGLNELAKIINPGKEQWRTVILSAGPMKGAQKRPDELVEFNRRVKAEAERRGWSYFDVWQTFRSKTNAGIFADRAWTFDGMHLTYDGAVKFGKLVSDYMVKLAAEHSQTSPSAS